MKKHEFYNDRIKLLREEIIGDVLYEMGKQGAQEIDLHNGVIHNYIDDQTNEVISSINTNKTVKIDTGFDSDVIPMSELSTDQLICILQMIEDGMYEITEDTETEI